MASCPQLILYKQKVYILIFSDKETHFLSALQEPFPALKTNRTKDNILYFFFVKVF